MHQALKGDLVLLFITLCWGITFPLIENAVAIVNPAVFVTVRFFFAAFFLLPFLFKKANFFNHSRLTLMAGAILGLLNTGTYVAQTIGLQTITSAEAAFITGISVVLVPFILPFFSLGSPKIKEIMGSLLCFLGLFFLVGYHFSHINKGHFWVLFCAVTNAIAIVYLQKVTKEKISLALLAFYQILFTAIFSLPFTIGKNYQLIFETNVFLSMIFCAFFATALALYLQTKFQRYTTANRAAMIYCLEPVFASIAGYLINHELLGWQAFIGGGFIFIGLFVSMYNFNK